MGFNKTLISAWPLFAGLVLLMVGNGLHGTLLAIRATIEGFDTAATGAIMSLYYGGYLLGCFLAPKLVKNVGHIRVFAALASLASVTILLQGMFITPYSWAAIRIVTGFCFAGIYIVVESWMNDIATKETRGKILAAYLLTFFSGMVIGQYLLNVAPPETIEPFLVVSVLVSLALLPIALSKRPAPDFSSPAPISPRELFRITPLSVYGVFVSGIGNGVFFTIGPVYAILQGMSVAQTANFMAIFIFGGVCGQLPLGYLSDKIGRRITIIAVSLIAFLSLLLCYLFHDTATILYPGLFLFGATALSLYGLCVAYTNDYLSPEHYVGASASQILTNGTGSLIGPFIIALVMSLLGSAFFFPLLAVAYASICLIGITRHIIKPALPIEEQVDYAALSPRATPITAQIANTGAEDE